MKELFKITFTIVLVIAFIAMVFSTPATKTVKASVPNGMPIIDTYEPFGDEYMGSTVYVLHDDKRSVTCWTRSKSYDGTMSCIPDYQLKP